jgi:hypothetical protein
LLSGTVANNNVCERYEDEFVWDNSVFGLAVSPTYTLEVPGNTTLLAEVKDFQLGTIPVVVQKKKRRKQF